MSSIHADRFQNAPISSEGDPDATLTELIRRSGLGDEHAFTRFFELVFPIVFAVVLRILRDPSEAEDVTLEVFVQSWEQAGRFDRSRASGSTWLQMIARSRATDRIRARHRQRRFGDSLPFDPVDLPASSDTPEAAYRRSELEMVLRAAIRRLPQDQRQLIELAYFEGRSRTEIARVLKQPLGTVKTRIRRAKANLRAAVDPER